MERGASTVIGVLLLVGVVVIVGGVVALGALTFLDGTGTPQATATFDYEQTPAGVQMTPQVISTTVTVQLNGRDVATFDPETAGQSVLLPTAPGDRITVVSRDGDQSVLVQRTVDDRSEIGDFIAYYTFDSGNEDTLVDRSGNGNNGTLEGNPTRTGESLQFDGSSDYVTIPSLNAPVSNVSSFTIAVTYRQEAIDDCAGTGSDCIDQLIEHTAADGDEWYLENDPDASGPDRYEAKFGVEAPQEVAASDENLQSGTRHVAVGTYDGSGYRLYVDGEQVDSGTHSRTVDMGRLRIARDDERDIQYLDGEIYEIRLYYTAFDGEEVDVITKAME